MWLATHLAAQVLQKLLFHTPAVTAACGILDKAAAAAAALVILPFVDVGIADCTPERTRVVRS